ncbi:MAG: phosphoribosyl-AMP cyclohydrolase [Thermodesulfobacteriota bacterium]
MISPDFEKAGGLVPVITQDAATGEVLMLAYANRAAWEATLESGKATYYSRSRKKLWVKGESSGNVQMIREIRIDCDNDTLLFKVEQIGGAACHKGYRSCFFTKVEADGTTRITQERVFDPEEVYTK